MRFDHRGVKSSKPPIFYVCVAVACICASRAKVNQLNQLDQMTATARRAYDLSRRIEALVELNPTGMRAELQRFGHPWPFNEQASFSTTLAFPAALVRVS